MPIKGLIQLYIRRHHPVFKETGGWVRWSTITLLINLIWTVAINQYQLLFSVV